MTSHVRVKIDTLAFSEFAVTFSTATVVLDCPTKYLKTIVALNYTRPRKSGRFVPGSQVTHVYAGISVQYVPKVSHFSSDAKFYITHTAGWLA